MGKLTARTVSGLSQKGRYADGDNLVLQVGPKGNKSWLFAYMRNGRSHQMGLGSASLVSLTEARDKAFLLRRQLKIDDIDPLATRRAAKSQASEVPTFKAFAEQWIAMQEAGWKNPKHRQQWRNTLTTYAYPVIGSLPVDLITTEHVVQILTPIWLSKPETAGRVQNRIALILDAAKAARLRKGDNPAEWKGNLKHLLPSQKKVKRTKHHGSLSYGDIPALVSELRERESMSAKALEFTILTAARTSETILATWPEIDFAKRTWTVPADRMKQGREHLVPLTDRAIEILNTLPREADNPHVFVGSRWKHGLSNMAMLELLKGMRGDGVTVHGTARSGFRTWAGEEGHSREVAEAALGHKLGDETEQAYNRGDLFALRRTLMKDWADFLDATNADGTGRPALARKQGAA